MANTRTDTIPFHKPCSRHYLCGQCQSANKTIKTRDCGCYIFWAIITSDKRSEMYAGRGLSVNLLVNRCVAAAAVDQTDRQMDRHQTDALCFPSWTRRKSANCDGLEVRRGCADEYQLTWRMFSAWSRCCDVVYTVW